METQRAKKARFITFLGLFTNIILTIFKLIAGLIGKSSAMIADAIHSLSDLFSDFVIIFSFKIVEKPADANHNYGHEKFETIASNIVGNLLIFIGLGILYNGGEKIYKHLTGISTIQIPSFVALIAAFVSIVSKEILFQVTKYTGKKINSDAIIANAWHHRTDALSSIATLIGIGGAIYLGEKWVILDPIACIIVSFMIIYAGAKISIKSFKELSEESVDPQTQQEILNIIQNNKNTINPHDLRTRKIGNKIAIDIHIRFKDEMSISEVHKITDDIEKQLRQQFGQNTIINIHCEPENE